jgi:anti-sigma B factor antagonist
MSQEVPMKMTTSTRQVGGITVVDISGRIEHGKESAAVRALVCDLFREGHTQILVNLGDVHYIDSSGLGALVSSFTNVRKQGGELKLLNLTNKVRELMQITKLYTVFDISNNEAEAVKSFSQPVAATA